MFKNYFSFISCSHRLELQMLQLHLHFNQLGSMLHTTGLLAHHTASLVLHPLLGSSLDLKVQVGIIYIKLCLFPLNMSYIPFY